jgi:hypothetical protein
MGKNFATPVFVKEHDLCALPFHHHQDEQR